MIKCFTSKKRRALRKLKACEIRKKEGEKSFLGSTGMPFSQRLINTFDKLCVAKYIHTFSHPSNAHERMIFRKF